MIRTLRKILINLLIGFGSIIVFIADGFFGFIFGVLCIILGDIAIDHIPQRSNN